MREVEKEYAVSLGRPKLVTVTRSLIRWHDFETTRLNAEHRLFNEELDKTYDPAKRMELVRALEENKRERRDLERGWENSSLRMRLSPGDNIQTKSDLIEHRLLVPTQDILQPVTLKKKSSHEKAKLTGYAAIFGRYSVEMFGFREIIKEGAFANVLKKKPDVRGLFNHDPSLLLGRTQNKSLRLYEDRTGLKFYCDLLDNDPISQTVIDRVARRDISGCSFSFFVAKDTWKLAQKSGELDERIILEIEELFDVGPVSFPAYPDTTCDLLFERSIDENTDTTDEPFDFWAMQDAEDEEIMKEIEEKMRARKRQNERGYRHAGRIINRNKGKL